jgi:hypothetical protein
LLPRRDRYELVGCTCRLARLDRLGRLERLGRLVRHGVSIGTARLDRHGLIERHGRMEQCVAFQRYARTDASERGDRNEPVVAANGAAAAAVTPATNGAAAANGLSAAVVSPAPVVPTPAAGR